MSSVLLPVVHAFPWLQLQLQLPLSSAAADVCLPASRQQLQQQTGCLLQRQTEFVLQHPGECARILGLEDGLLAKTVAVG